ncbi:MAG: hypothetical protein LPK45_02115, partial [Bacteroidota bacterium]|nr:hypothetical protein [Bacteroidota bacterium]MDX5429829.1 hypothetical protein [Bacteroidota bacterium]MDX5468608.1 hypothetical protein [Bacteroidota bacterium]
CWIGKIGLLARIFHLSKVEKGTHTQLRFVRMMDSSHITLKSEEKLTCHMDGEVYQWDHFEVEMQAGVMKILS